MSLVEAVRPMVDIVDSLGLLEEADADLDQVMEVLKGISATHVVAPAGSGVDDDNLALSPDAEIFLGDVASFNGEEMAAFLVGVFIAFFTLFGLALVCETGEWDEEEVNKITNKWYGSCLSKASDFIADKLNGEAPPFLVAAAGMGISSTVQLSEFIPPNVVFAAGVKLLDESIRSGTSDT